MALLILGNGFDLGSGLPTKYQNYFFYRFNILKDYFMEYDDILNLNFPSDVINNYLDGIIENPTLPSGVKDTTVLDGLLKNEIINKLSDRITSFKSLYNSASGIYVNFFDILFYHKYLLDNKTDLEWSSVEKLISDFLNFDSLSPFGGEWHQNYQKLTSLKSVSNNSMTLNYECEHFVSRLSLQDPNIANNINIFEKNRNNQSDITEILINSFFSLEKYETEKEIIHFLMNELNLFENEFKKYMMIIQKEIDQQMLNTYVKNVNILFGRRESSKDLEHQILNFNYTLFKCISSSSLTKLHTSYPNTHEFTIEGAKISQQPSQIKVKCNNVHGNLTGDIIFGVDQEAGIGYDKQSKMSKYIFTKTYRKLLHSIGEENFSLPKKTEVKRILFYGHSLAPADYSYFQSIFDYYNIYEGTTKLVFMISEYHEDHLSNIGLRREKISEISELMQSYGKSMINKEQGKNLLHKLQLENRIQVKVVKLTQMDFIRFNKEKKVTKMEVESKFEFISN